jgi:PAS domain S-box-containing protein
LKLRFRSKPASFGFGLALLLLTGAFWLSYLNTGRLLEATRWRQRTEDVISEIRALLAVAADLETGVRGFVITGSERFLPPYQAARDEIPARFARLRELTADNPRQQRRLESLDPLLRERTAWTGSTISLFREKGREAAAARIGTGRGRDLMEQIRELLTAMEGEEQRLLLERELAVKARSARANLALLAAAALSLVLLLVAFTALDREVRERSRAEAQAQASESEARRVQAFLDSVVENIPNMIFVKEARELKFVRVNRAGEELLGHPREALLGRNDYDFFPKEQADCFTSMDREVLEKRALLDVPEESILTKDGRRRFLHTKKVPLFDGTGRPAFLLGISEDITDWKQAQERFRLAVESSPSGMAMVDDKGRIVLVNAETERLFGYRREELIGQSIDMLVPERFRGQHHHLRASFLSRPEARSMGAGRDLFGLRRDGTEFPVEIGLNPIQTATGTLVLSALMDITERKRAEDEVRRARERAETVNQELEAFSYSVSHDLRAPLRHIGGFVDMLRRRALSSLDETSQKYLDTIAKSSKRMGDLIDDLLVFSRMGRVEMGRAKVPLAPVVAEILRELQEDVKGRKIDWKIDPLPEVQGDPAMLRQVFINLISNAVKYTRTRLEARIEIGARSSNGDTVVFVRDNGIGFDAQYAHKLFGVFQRLHGAEEFEGTGIGLANVRRIIQRHGGRTWAEGEPDRGATFYVSLPGHKETTG